MIRNIIFDWSGTLVDDLPAVWQASNVVFERAGMARLSLDRFRAEFSLPYDAFYRQFVAHVPLPQLEAWFHECFPRFQAEVVELEHARAFLEFCRGHRLRTCLLSTVRAEQFRTQCAQNGFDRYLDHVHLEVVDKRLRIGPLLAEQGWDPRQTLFVGDMQHDIETAHHGGVHSCAVLTGYNRLDQLRAARPDMIVEHLAELRGVLERGGFEMPNERAWARGAAPAPGGGERAGAGDAPVVTVGALVFDDAGRVLMVRTHKWSDLWGIPGGKVNRGETSLDAVRREIREETGLELADVKFVLVQDCIDSPEFYRPAHFLLLNYTARCVGAPDVRLNHEAQTFRWASLVEARALPLNRPTRLLLDAMEGRDGSKEA